MAIIFACTPFLKPFIEQLHTGILAGDAEAPGHNHFSTASVLEKLKPTARSWHRDCGGDGDGGNGGGNGQSQTNLGFAAPWLFKEIDPMSSSNTHMVQSSYHSNSTRCSGRTVFAAGSEMAGERKQSYYISLASVDPSAVLGKKAVLGRSKKHPELMLNTMATVGTRVGGNSFTTTASHKPQPARAPPPPAGVINKTTTTTISIHSPRSLQCSERPLSTNSNAPTCSSLRSSSGRIPKPLPSLPEYTTGRNCLNRGIAELDHNDFHATKLYHDRIEIVGMTPTILPTHAPPPQPRALGPPMRTRKFVTVERAAEAMWEGERVLKGRRVGIR